MAQADVSKLVSQLRIKINPTHRRLKNPEGPKGRLDKLRETVTALVKYERLELNYNRADEARGYAERLISDAIRYGDCHKTTMEMADFWLIEKQLVHKLFKVLAPRYENYTTSYTRIWKASQMWPSGRYKRSVLELKGNPFPPLYPDTRNNRNLIHNILLDEAKKEYRVQKYAELAEKLSQESDKEKLSTVTAESKSVAEEISASAEQKLTSSEEKLPEQETPSSSSSPNKETTDPDKASKSPSS